MKVFTICLLSTCLMYVTSCRTTNKSYEYLKTKDSFFGKTSVTPSEGAILKKAFDRMDPYVVLKEDGFVLTVKSGKEIGMSKDLFRFCKSNMDITNAKIARGELKVVDGKLIRTESYKWDILVK